MDIVYPLCAVPGRVTAILCSGYILPCPCGIQIYIFRTIPHYPLQHILTVSEFNVVYGSKLTSVAVRVGGGSGWVSDTSWYVKCGVTIRVSCDSFTTDPLFTLAWKTRARIPARVGIVVYGEGGVRSRVEHRDILRVGSTVTLCHGAGDDWIVLEAIGAGIRVEEVVGGDAVVAKVDAEIIRTRITLD